MGRGWRRWSEDEARAALEKFSRSGETLAEFARRNQVSTQRIFYWRKRLRVTTPPAFVSFAVPSTSRASSRQIEVVVGSLSIRVGEDIDGDVLSRIIDVLVRQAR